MSNHVPDGWERCKIGKVSKLQGGYAFKSADSTDNGIPWLKIANVGKGEIKWEDRSYLPSDFIQLHSDFLLNTGDCVLALTRPITGGELKVAQIRSYDTPALLNQRVARVKPDSSLVNQDFIYSMFRYEEITREIEITIFGTDPPNVSTKQIEDIKFNFPPLPEQQKIAAILSSADEVIEKTQAQIDKLKDLKTAMMQELLTKGIGHTEFKDSPVGTIPAGWDVESFDELFTLKNGVNKGKEYFGKGIPIISYRNVYDGGGIHDDEIIGLVDLNEGELARFRVKYGDLFITRTSETPDEIGYVNVYLGNRNDVVYNGFVIRARQTHDRLSPTYCKYAFQTYAVRNQMILNSKFTTRAGISGESLARLKIAIPPKIEQEKITKVLSAIDNRINALSEKNKSKKAMKQALMQDLLTGKVRVNTAQATPEVAVN
jgi:type I restriction enzyme S subunit